MGFPKFVGGDTEVPAKAPGEIINIGEPAKDRNVADVAVFLFEQLLSIFQPQNLEIFHYRNAGGPLKTPTEISLVIAECAAQRLGGNFLGKMCIHIFQYRLKLCVLLGCYPSRSQAVAAEQP